jgi:Tfp pilus assembly protein PilN
MKTIHLNLAAKPYRDYRPVYLTVAAMGLVTLVLLAYNVVTGYEYLIETKQTRAEIASIENETAGERKLAAELDERIDLIDLRTLDRRSRFINAQIKERAFSFSQLLDDLERTLPHDVKLTDLNPVFDDQGGIRLALSCLARKRDGMTDLLNRLYEDPKFEKAFPRSERIETDGSFRFNIEVEYLPEATNEEAAE